MQWDDAPKICGETLGFYYIWNGEVKPYAHHKFKKFRKRIEKNILARARTGICLDDNTDREWRGVLDNFEEQVRTEYLQSMEEDDDELETAGDWEEIGETGKVACQKVGPEGVNADGREIGSMG